jgi:hypothetical protein
MEKLLAVMTWIVGILVSGVLVIAVCYVPHDLSLAKEISVSIFQIMTSMVFLSVASFVAGVIVTIWCVFSGKIKAWFLYSF